MTQIKRLYKNILNILDIKLPKFSTQDDAELIEHVNIFKQASEQLIEFLNENVQYTTPKEYKRVKPIVVQTEEMKQEKKLIKIKEQIMQLMQSNPIEDLIQTQLTDIKKIIDTPIVVKKDDTPVEIPIVPQVKIIEQPTIKKR